MAPFNFANLSVIFKIINVTRTNNIYISLTELVCFPSKGNNSIWNSKIFPINFVGNIKSNYMVVILPGDVWTRAYKNNTWKINACNIKNKFHFELSQAFFITLVLLVLAIY